MIYSESFLYMFVFPSATITFYLFCLKFFFMCICLCMCMLHQVYASAGRSQKRASDSCSWNYMQLWAAQHGYLELGMGLQSSGAASSFNH